MPKRQEIIVEEIEETEEVVRPEQEEPEPEPIFSEPLPVKPERIKKRRHIRIFTPKFFIGLLILLGILGLAFLVYFVLPRAQVIINPQKEKVTFNVGITVDKNIDSIDVEQAKIPGQLFETEKMTSREFPATGEKLVEEKARGTITVYNEYSSSPQTLVKTTRFRSTDGKIFRATDTNTIPGAIIEEGKIIASSKDIGVIADEAGEAYNIGPSNFTIPGFEGTPKYTAFYGKSTKPMTGGAKGKMKVATDSDIKGATNIVTLELKDQALKQFQEKIPADLKLLEGNRVSEVVETISSLKANQPGEKFTITVKVKVSGLAFKEGDAKYLVEKDVSAEIPKDKTVLLSSIKIDYKVSKLDLSQGKSVLSGDVEAETVLSFDEQKIKDELAGKNETDVRKYLSSLPGIETAKVVFWPFWVKRVPTDKDKIKVMTRVE